MKKPSFRPRVELLVGNYIDVLADRTAHLIFTSPPYNIGSDSPARTGTRNKRNGTYDPKSYRGIREYPDRLPELTYQEGQRVFLAWAHDRLKPGGILVYNHKPRRQRGCLIHPCSWLLDISDLVLMEEIIWDRGSTHNHCNRLLWPHTERLYVFRRKQDQYAFRNRQSLEYRSDVWRIAPSKPNGHNAPFPLKLALAVVEAWSKQGNVVMDPFMGSGTTAVAASMLKRRFVGAEILPKYHRMACETLKATGE